MCAAVGGRAQSQSREVRFVGCDIFIMHLQAYTANIEHHARAMTRPHVYAHARRSHPRPHHSSAKAADGRSKCVITRQHSTFCGLLEQWDPPLPPGTIVAKVGASHPRKGSWIRYDGRDCLPLSIHSARRAMMPSCRWPSSSSPILTKSSWSPPPPSAAARAARGGQEEAARARALKRRVRSGPNS